MLSHLFGGPIMALRLSYSIHLIGGTCVLAPFQDLLLFISCFVQWSARGASPSVWCGCTAYKLMIPCILLRWFCSICLFVKEISKCSESFLWTEQLQRWEARITWGNTLIFLFLFPPPRIGCCWLWWQELAFVQVQSEDDEYPQGCYLPEVQEHARRWGSVPWRRTTWRPYHPGAPEGQASPIP